MVWGKSLDPSEPRSTTCKATSTPPSRAVARNMWDMHFKCWTCWSSVSTTTACFYSNPGAQDLAHPLLLTSSPSIFELFFAPLGKRRFNGCKGRVQKRWVLPFLFLRRNIDTLSFQLWKGKLRSWLSIKWQAFTTKFGYWKPDWKKKTVSSNITCRMCLMPWDQRGKLHMGLQQSVHLSMPGDHMMVTASMAS